MLANANGQTRKKTLRVSQERLQLGPNKLTGFTGARDIREVHRLGQQRGEGRLLRRLETLHGRGRRLRATWRRVQSLEQSPSALYQMRKHAQLAGRRSARPDCSEEGQRPGSVEAVEAGQGEVGGVQEQLVEVATVELAEQLPGKARQREDVAPAARLSEVLRPP